MTTAAEQKCRNCGSTTELQMAFDASSMQPICMKCLVGKAAKKPTYKELVECIAGLVGKYAYDVHCGPSDEGGVYHDGGLSALEEAFDLLEQLGVMEKLPGKKEHYKLHYERIEEIK